MLALILFFNLLFTGIDPVIVKDPKAEYYRGVYDVCVYQGIKNHYEPAFVKTACDAYVGEKVKLRWYEKKSDGWKWPVNNGETGG